jgi:hypothetical protein
MGIAMAEVRCASFDMNCALDDAFAPLEALPCMWPMTFLSGVHSSYRLGTVNFVQTLKVLCENILALLSDVMEEAHHGEGAPGATTTYDLASATGGNAYDVAANNTGSSNNTAAATNSTGGTGFTPQLQRILRRCKELGNLVADRIPELRNASHRNQLASAKPPHPTPTPPLHVG